jgi:hypothetical protein
MPNSTTFFYCAVDHDDETRHQHRVPGKWSLDNAWEASEVAAEVAEDYHSNHDGWESSWPLTFALYETEDGPEKARFSVDRATVARFTAVALNV